MKAITKRDLSVIRALQMMYPDLGGVTIGKYIAFPDQGTEVVDIKIPEVQCEVTVVLREKKVEKLFFPAPDPMTSYKPIIYAVNDAGVKRIPC